MFDDFTPSDWARVILGMASAFTLAWFAEPLARSITYTTVSPAAFRVLAFMIVLTVASGMVTPFVASWLGGYDAALCAVRTASGILIVIGIVYWLTRESVAHEIGLDMRTLDMAALFVGVLTSVRMIEIKDRLAPSKDANE